MAALTSREIVRRCIEFRDPPRIAWHFDVMPIAGRTWPVTDFAFATYAADLDVQHAPGVDEWGMVHVTFDLTGEDIGQVKEHPLGDGWHLLDTYRFPDFSKPARYAHLAAEAAQGHAAGKYVYGAIPALMTLPADLRGVENWFIDHLTDFEPLTYLLELIVAARLQIIDAYAAAGFDGVITWDDMGVHDRAMLSPELFRTIYYPHYKRTCDALHERGMHFIHHCCGMVREYIPLFIEAGCDVLQLDQPTLMGIDWLAEYAGGKICFWNSIDIQRTLGTGNLAAIADEARHQCWAFGQYGGGFMVKAYQQPNAIGMTVAEFEAMYATYLHHAAYPLQMYRSLNPALPPENPEFQQRREQ